MKKLFCLLLTSLCLLAAVSGCGTTPTQGPEETPFENPNTTQGATASITENPTTAIANLTAKERFESMGYEIRFDGVTEERPDEDGFNMPHTDVTVVLLKNGSDTDFKPQVKDLIGGMMDEWYNDPEYVVTIYQPPGEFVAATSVYYAGYGDEIFVSFDQASGLLTVWHRVFYEGGPDTPIEECYEDWVTVATKTLT